MAKKKAASTDIAFELGVPANTTLADWLNVNANTPVDHIEKRASFWRIFFA